METILVPTDFSEAAENAAVYAANFARSVNARILLFHVYHVPVSGVSDFPVMPMALDELHSENEAWLRKASTELRRKTGADVTYQATMGLAADEILEVQNVDLIIMGMKGTSRVGEVLLGSIAASTFRKSKIPVLLIPEKSVFTKPKTIIFACDYDPAANFNEPVALQKFAKAFAPKIYVVNVKQKKESVTIREQITIRPHEQTDNVEHLYYFPEKEDLAAGINEFAMEHNGDLIAVIPHHYGLIEGLFHKSISKKLAFHSHVPLLALPDNRKSKI